MAAGGSQTASRFLNALSQAAERFKKWHPAARKLACGTGLAVTALNFSMYTVDGGQRAVIFDCFHGVLDDTVGEGIHFRVPFLQKPYIFNIRSRPHDFTFTSGTKDLQIVNLSLFLLARPEVNLLPTIFTSLGGTTEYDKKVLPSLVNEALKAVVAQFNAEQLLTERPHVYALICDSIIRKARDLNIVIDDVAITQLSYTETKLPVTVEEKQEAERFKFLVAKAEQESSEAGIRAVIVAMMARSLNETDIPRPESVAPNLDPTRRRTRNWCSTLSNVTLGDLLAYWFVRYKN